MIRGALRDTDLKLGTNPEFQYPRKARAGFGEIARVMASHIESIHYGMEVESIDPQKKIVSFHSNGTAISYDNLVSTLPLPKLIAMLPAPPKEVLQAVAELRYNSIAIVNLGVDRSGLSTDHWIHYPEDDISFFRISFPTNFVSDLCPSGTDMVQAEISYNKNRPPDRNTLIDQVVRDLIKVDVLASDDRLVFQDVVYVEYGYVIYDHNRKEAVRTIHEYLHSLDIHACGRYGAWEYLWSDEAVMSGKAAAECVLQQESADGRTGS